MENQERKNNTEETKQEPQAPKMRWTAEQQRVIDTRNRNLLVSAAAGSGKTAVLVERIIQMVTDEKNPVDIDRLLIVTFTNAAASEMRERIGLAIEKKLMECPEDEHLQKQMTLIHSAQITTTHSFCQNVIRNNFNLIDLDPTFRIGEEAELTLMQSDVIAAILEEEYEKGEEAFLNFVESYSNSKSDEPLEALILQLYKFSMSYPWPREWLASLGSVFELTSVEEMEQQKFMQVLLDYVHSVVGDLQEKIKEAIEVADSVNGPYTYLDTLYQDQQQLGRLSGLSTYEEYYLALKGLEFGRLSTKKAEGVDEKKKDQVKDIRKLIKDIKDDLIDDYFFQPEDQMLQDIQSVHPVMEELIRLTLRFEEEYRKMKEEKVMIDFNDLEHMALQILVKKDGDVISPSNVAMELSEFYEEIMVDEYQDSNMVQETILNSISKERLGHPNIFMVGDVKQSIYKFRLARPELFMEKYETYTSEDSLYQKIDLHKNFRSRKLVLDAINYICEQIMTKKLGNIEYDEDAALYAGAQFPESEDAISQDSELILVTLTETENPMAGGTKEASGESDGSSSGAELPDEDEEEEYTKKEMEAKAIAMRIKELIQGEHPLQVFDKKGFYRPASYKDIVILLRTMSNWADVFVDTLLSEGIPAYADTASGYFKTLEIKTILNMLRIIDNPLQDIPYTAVLHSPMGGFENEELAILRKYDREAPMHHVVMRYANGEYTKEEQEGNQRFLSEEELHTLQDKCKQFVQMLKNFREMEQYLSIHELILKILEDTYYYDFVSAMPAGNVRKANIDMLVERAITFENTSYKGLFHFIRYMEKLHKYDVDFGEASVSNENDDTVRIMSIHKSKGLEFPVVFVSGMGKSFNNQDARNKIVIHPDMGLGPDVIDLNLRVKAPTLVKKVIQKMQVLENLGEELRVLYVALTRAKEKLIMTGFTKDLEKLFKKYQGVRQQTGKALQFLQLTRAGSFLDYVVPALMKHDAVYHQLLMFLNPGYEWREEEQAVPLNLRVVTPSMLIRAERKKQVTNELGKDVFLNWDSKERYNDTVKAQIEDILNYQYPFQREVELHAKVTVSELKRLRQRDMAEESEVLIPEDPKESEDTTQVQRSEAVNRADFMNSKEEQTNSEEQSVSGDDSNPTEAALFDEPEPIIPNFMRTEEVVSGAARGTLYHKVLEEMDLFDMKSVAEIRTRLDELVAAKKISEEALQKVNCKQLYQFAKSPLAARMKKANEVGKLYREQQFVMGIKANEINEAYVSDEIMLVQGIIDVFFEEEDELVLMDYKTDMVRSRNEQELVDKYKVQLDYYQRALEQITGKKVKEKIIYSFYLGKEIVIGE